MVYQTHMNSWKYPLPVALWCGFQPCRPTSVSKNTVYMLNQKTCLQGISYGPQNLLPCFSHLWMILWGEIVILLFLILPIIRFLKLLRYFAAWRFNKCGLGGRMDAGKRWSRWNLDLGPPSFPPFKTIFRIWCWFKILEGFFKHGQGWIWVPSLQLQLHILRLLVFVLLLCSTQTLKF